jgi:hypothetical protein
MALSVSHILLGNFSLISKGAHYFSYRWVIFFYFQKVLSISHMLLGNFSIFSKDAQYFSYPYRWAIFHYSQETPSISHVRWFITGSTWYKVLYQHTMDVMGIYPTVSSISRLALINNQQTTWHGKYWEFLGNNEKLPIILLGNFSLFSKGAQYFSYRWLIFLYSQKAFMRLFHMLDIKITQQYMRNTERHLRIKEIYQPIWEILSASWE